jgi:hypothetical protein
MTPGEGDDNERPAKIGEDRHAPHTERVYPEEFDAQPHQKCDPGGMIEVAPREMPRPFPVERLVTIEWPQGPNHQLDE